MILDIIGCLSRKGSVLLIGPDSPFLLEVVKSRITGEFMIVSPAEYFKHSGLPLEDYLRLSFESCFDRVLIIESVEELTADDNCSRMELLRLLTIYCNMPIIAYAHSIESFGVAKEYFEIVYNTPSLLDREDIEYLGATEGVSYKNFVKGEHPSLQERKDKVRPVAWNKVGGMRKIKEQVMNASRVLFDAVLLEKYKEIGCSPPTSLLLSGPPGTGKTLLARALATELNAVFIACSLGDLLHAYIGESERSLAKLFIDAMAASPCIVFLDELDALFSGKGMSGVGSRLVAHLIYELDGLRDNASKRILVIGATNFAECIDNRLMGRFDVLLTTSMPDASERADIFETLEIPNEFLTTLIKHSDGMSGAEIAQMVQLARQRAYERRSDRLEVQDFQCNVIYLELPIED